MNKSFRARLLDAKKHEQKLFSRIRGASQKGHSKIARHLASEYLMSFDCKLVAVHQANSKMRMYKRVLGDKMLQIAGYIDPWQGTEEKVTLNLKPKAGKNYEYRPVMDFGIENRALQYLVRGALQPQIGELPHQYATSGGCPAAIEDVLKRLYEGYLHVAEIDITDNFLSFDEGMYAAVTN